MLRRGRESMGRLSHLYNGFTELLWFAEKLVNAEKFQGFSSRTIRNTILIHRKFMNYVNPNFIFVAFREFLKTKYVKSCKLVGSEEYFFFFLK